MGYHDDIIYESLEMKSGYGRQEVSVKLSKIFSGKYICSIKLSGDGEWIEETCDKEEDVIDFYNQYSQYGDFSVLFQDAKIGVYREEV